MKTQHLLILALVGTAAGIGVFGWQRQQANSLREEIVHLQQANRAAAAEAARPQPVAKKPVSPFDEDEPERVKAEIAKTQRDIAAMEDTLRRLPAALSPPRQLAFTTNRDPEKGFVRIEHFVNAGQATPAAAFQTFVWALETQNYESLVSLFGISPKGRESLRAIVARLDPAAQARFTPPEKILGLLYSSSLLKEDGYQIGPATAPDAQGKVVLQVLRASGQPDQKMAFLLGAAGWQIPIPDEMIEAVPRGLEGASMYVPPKRGQ